MVSVELKEKARAMETTAEELNLRAVQQVTDILEEAQKATSAPQPKTGHWYYAMPFAGVRYYSY